MKFSIILKTNNVETFRTPPTWNWHFAEIIIKKLGYTFCDKEIIFIKNNKTAEIVAENGLPF